MDTKGRKFMYGAMMIIGTAITCICGKNYINEMTDTAAINGYEAGVEYGTGDTLKMVRRGLKNAYGDEKGHEIWNDIFRNQFKKE